MEIKQISDIKQRASKIYFNDMPAQKKTLIEREKILLNLEVINIDKNKSYDFRIIDLSNHAPLNIQIKDPKNSNKYIIESIYEFIFGKEQKLLIEMKIKEQTKQAIYKEEISVGQLIGNNRMDNNKKDQIFQFEGINEEILIKAEKLKNKDKFLVIHFTLRISSNNNEIIDKEQIVKYFTEEEYKFYFTVEKKIDKKMEIIYESETFTDNGKFNIIQIPIKFLKTDFFISFKNMKKRFGTICTNLKKITEKMGDLFFVQRLTINHILEIYNYSTIRDEITFLDYINEKIRIGLCIGIDFTISNKTPDKEDSLHCITNVKKNPYERAILSCGNILAYYDYDQKFPVFGFGAVVGGKNSSCFNINFEDDPNIEFINNIIECYHKCLKKITFSGPTNFAPIIKRIINDIKIQNDPKEYQVLMILTDGIIRDMDDTIDALVEGSFYPLSVIIIGIGNANDDFSKMEQLDGDDIPLISRNGIKRQRDLVQFVPFNKFEGNEEKLAYEVLEEIPRQIIEYYTLNFVYPERLQGKEEEEKVLRDTFNLETLKRNNSKEIEENIKKDKLFPNASYRLFDDDDDVKNNKTFIKPNQNKYNYSEIDDFLKIAKERKKGKILYRYNTINNMSININCNNNDLNLKQTNTFKGLVNKKLLFSSQFKK